MEAEFEPESFKMKAKIDPKSIKSEPGGTPKWQQEAKMKKRGVVPNSFAVF